MMCDDLCIFSQVFFSKEFLTNSGCCLFTTPITEAISFCLPWHVRAAWSFRGALSVQKLVMPQKDPLGKHTKCAMNLCYPWAMFAFAGCWTCFLAKCPSVTKGKPADNHDKHGYPSMKFCDPGDAQLAAQVLGSSIKNMTS